MHYKRLPLTAQTAYADLIARVREDSVLEIEGSPVLRDRNGRKYWYSVQRFAERTVEKYLGPDNVDIRGRVEQARRVKDDQKTRQKQRRPLVEMCRKGGMQSVDAAIGKVLMALATAGMFRLRGVLVGTHAFRCYPALLGVDIPEAHAATEDIDVAAFLSISVALDDALEPSLEGVLRKVGPFAARPSLHHQPTSWRDAEDQTVVELLTPNVGPDREAPVLLPAINAYAMPLRYLDFLIHDAIQAVALYRSGVLVNVPRPARYAIHKVIIATRRHENAQEKARKDIEQAAALIRVLAEDQPDALEDACVEAWERGPRWRHRLGAGVRRLPKDARDMIEETVASTKIDISRKT